MYFAALSKSWESALACYTLHSPRIARFSLHNDQFWEMPPLSTTTKGSKKQGPYHAKTHTRIQNHMFYLIILWLVLSLVLASWALDKKIGFRNAFLLSFFLSPLIGLIGILLSRNQEEVMQLTTILDRHKLPEPKETKVE